ncbi:hypothetical protein [Tenacibaculum sp. Bg11-29]|uniref:hypothetical protein n=1 Tax=Tenacibaculum sp. Bg11-29 TaxID=2058306 RepID=UPI0012FE8250|nr:hypothetical protein [Tenacibaculum sp. Bg11-29]
MNPYIAGVILIATFFIIEYLAYYLYLSKTPKRKLWQSKNQGMFSLSFLFSLSSLYTFIQWLLKVI